MVGRFHSFCVGIGLGATTAPVDLAAHEALRRSLDGVPPQDR